MKKQRYNFNLIEIVLTVAVISFGVVVILGMLPKGLRAARNTATVSYASEVMEQMGYYIQNQNLANLPSDFADVADSADVKAKYMSLIKGATTGFNATGITDVYQYTAGATKGVYIIVVGNTETINGEDATNVVFSGMLRVAKSESDLNRIAARHSCTEAADNCSQTCGLADTEFENKPATGKITTVHMELSYPLSVDYASRSKSYYTFDAN